MTKGIQLSTNGDALDGDYTEFDTRRRRIQTALRHSPPHLDIFDIGPATGLQTNSGNGFYAEETLFSIKHGLPYKPKVLVYFFRYDTENYNVGKLFFDFGAFEDSLVYKVTDTEFSIKHVLNDTFFNIGLTSTAAAIGKIRLKYLILSVPINKLVEELTV